MISLAKFLTKAKFYEVAFNQYRSSMFCICTKFTLVFYFERKIICILVFLV